jgi:hypothetical protein
MSNDPTLRLAKELLAGYAPGAAAGAYTDLCTSMMLLDKMRQKGHRWLINMEPGGFYLRRVVWVTEHMERGEKTYTVDKPLGWAKTLDDLPLVIAKAVDKETRAKSRRRRIVKGRAR